jgi:hypothetical protein
VHRVALLFLNYHFPLNISDTCKNKIIPTKAKKAALHATNVNRIIVTMNKHRFVTVFIEGSQAVVIN